MLKTITIKNFQAHHKLVLSLSPTITTIVGPSDAGKSATIRALQWLVFNRPGGTAFINWGKPSQTAEVVVQTEENSISRSRGPNINTYTKGAKEFNAIGTDVPPVIKEALGLAEINFQAQHDSPFWFAETAGEVSRQLNTIIDQIGRAHV
jgi:DNA repair protein SbcC/Rad50